MECRGTKNLPNTTRACMLEPLLDSVHLTYNCMYIRDLKCIYCMKNIEQLNPTYCVDVTFFKYMSDNANSILGNKIAYFREKYMIEHYVFNLNKHSSR